MTDYQDIVFEDHPSALVATVTCENMDYMIIDKLKRRIGSQAALVGKFNVILDLATVGYIPSVILGALVDMLRTLQQEGRRLILTGMNRNVRSAFTVTGMDRLFTICETTPQALASVHPHEWR